VCEYKQAAMLKIVNAAAKAKAEDEEAHILKRTLNEA
jgi:hypothetical protein